LVVSFISSNFVVTKNLNIMPYKSKAQERWAHTPAGEKALGGKNKVHEWDESSKGKRLPEHTPKKKK
jgi:hypothetical protein